MAEFRTNPKRDLAIFRVQRLVRLWRIQGSAQPLA
jgi:hypothetical protein